MFSLVVDTQPWFNGYDSDKSFVDTDKVAIRSLSLPPIHLTSVAPGVKELRSSFRTAEFKGNGSRLYTVQYHVERQTSAFT